MLCPVALCVCVCACVRLCACVCVFACVWWPCVLSSVYPCLPPSDCWSRQEMEGGRASCSAGTEVSAVVASVLPRVRRTPHGRISKVANVMSYKAVLLTVVKIRQLVSDCPPHTHAHA